MLNDFERESECTYKGETYSVRDNGAVLRHPRIGHKPRPMDNVWTFGKYNAKTGYAEIVGERVHRIVATTFHGPAPSPQHVVDHIDTNRRNNRPENLRWITKLENILLNPITAKKIIFLCGSIEEFLKDPSILRKNENNRDFEWMRAVSKEEAAASLNRMLDWAKSDKPSFGGSLGEWIYQRSLPGYGKGKANVSTATENAVDGSKEKETTEIRQTTAKAAQDKLAKTNPFDFPRPNTANSSGEIRLYRTRTELFGSIKAQLDSDKRIKLPDIVLPTAGKGIVIRESWIEEFQEIEYYYEGKSRIPKSLGLHCKNGSYVALLFLIEAGVDGKERDRLKSERQNIVEIDLSWAKDGVTDLEMEYILQTDITKKKWICNEQIPKAREMLMRVCEPIEPAGQGGAHSYFACPLYLKSIMDLDCLYCNYRIDIEPDRRGAPQDSLCFGKARIQTYEELVSVIDVKKEDERIVGITYNGNGKIETKRFDKEVQLPGKTIFQLWSERKNKNIVVHNIYSDWYVLIENDPQESFDKTGEVYGKLGKSVRELKDCEVRSIYSFNSYCWEIVK